MTRVLSIGTLLLLITAASAQAPFVFRDVGEAAGIFPAAEGLRGHGAAWGDVNGDGWLDLYVATFGGKDFEGSAAYAAAATGQDALLALQPQIHDPILIACRAGLASRNCHFARSTSVGPLVFSSGPALNP